MGIFQNNKFVKSIVWNYPAFEISRFLVYCLQTLLFLIWLLFLVFELFKLQIILRNLNGELMKIKRLWSGVT